MKQKIRPLSPHLTIYKPQLTSVLSIFHRITGSLLGLSIVLSFVLFYNSLFYMGSSFQYSISFDFFYMFATLVLTIGYFIVFMMSYHLLNGIRHLSWDLALGLEIKNLYTTGMIVLGLVFVVVVIVILL
jgi:succinate dehydrogenase cytochrome b556 subunit